MAIRSFRASSPLGTFPHARYALRVCRIKTVDKYTLPTSSELSRNAFAYSLIDNSTSQVPVRVTLTTLH